MREWYVIAELTGLPGLPGTVQGVNAKAKRDQWRSRPRKGRGGGREYHLDSLPRATKNHITYQAYVRSIREIGAACEALPHLIRELSSALDTVRRYREIPAGDFGGEDA